MQDPEQVDWNSEEGKQVTERLNSFLRNIDKSAAKNGYVRKALSLGKSDSGEELKILAWRKP